MTHDGLLTVPAAAKAADEPERSLYRAVGDGDVPCVEQDGVKLVSLADVEIWAASRRPPAPAPTLAALLPGPAATLPPLAAGVGGRVAELLAGPVAKASPKLTKKTFKALFGYFSEGIPLQDIVRLHGRHPDDVEAAKARWDRLESLSGPRAEPLDELRREVEKLRQVAADAVDIAMVADAIATSLRRDLPKFAQESRAAIAGLNDRLATLEQRVAELERSLSFLMSLPP